MIAATRSAATEQTEALGASLAPFVESGDLVVLTGPLGAGKTRWVAGLAHGLGATGRVRSPTFTLIAEYHGRLLLAHADLYRLAEPVEPGPLGLDEYLERGVLAVEWGERLPAAWRAGALEVALAFEGADARRLEARAGGERSLALLRAWSESWPAA